MARVPGCRVERASAAGSSAGRSLGGWERSGFSFQGLNLAAPREARRLLMGEGQACRVLEGEKQRELRLRAS